MDERVIKTVNEARWIDGQNARNRLDDITYNPMRSQEEFVMRLMRENARTAYGRLFNFKSIHTLEDFRRCIPVTEYDDYSPYIDRIASGERNMLTAYLTEHLSPFHKLISVIIYFHRRCFILHTACKALFYRP